MKKLFFYKTDIGKIGIAEENTFITNLFFENDIVPLEIITQETPLLKEAGKQLQDYFVGRIKEFSLPMAPQGTEFMKSVWKALCEIPYGETRSYHEIAQNIGKPKASRAVGLANNRNPIPVFIPCHRVIGSNGKLTGYRGGLELKTQLLEVEKKYKLLYI